MSKTGSDMLPKVTAQISRGFRTHLVSEPKFVATV